MEQKETSKHWVKQLPDRYGRVKSRVYVWMKMLDISTERIGRKTYISSQDVQVLDDLHDFLQSKGTTIAEFVEIHGKRLRESPPPDSASQLSPSKSPKLKLLIIQPELMLILYQSDA